MTNKKSKRRTLITANLNKASLEPSRIVLLFVSVLILVAGLMSTSASAQVIDLGTHVDFPDLAIIQGPPDFGPHGEPLIEYFALSMASGDFNGDGINDLAIAGASPGAFAPTGSVYIFYGMPIPPSAPKPITIDMSKTPAHVAIKAFGPDAVGFAWNLTAGDIDGDGTDELFISALLVEADTGGPAGGKVIGLHIPPPPPLVPIIDLTDSSTPLIFDALGKDASDFLGEGMACGNINDDGNEELILGAPGASGGDGAIYIIDFDALEDSKVVLTPSIEAAGIKTLMVADPNAKVGHAIAVGDIDDDGTNEIIAGAPYFSDGAGKVYVLENDGNEVSSFTGEPEAYLGYALTCGDLNGDSIDDIVMGAPGADAPAIADLPARMDCGAVYIAYGPPNDVNVTIYGMKGDPDGVSNAPFPTSDIDDPGGLFGSSLASGDTDLDGLDDLVIGAPYEDGTAGLYTGRAWLLQEMAYTDPNIIIDLGLTPERAKTVIIGGKGTGAVADGELVGDFMGYSVLCSDITGDKAADMIAGATNDPIFDPGKVIVMFGTDPNSE